MQNLQKLLEHLATSELDFILVGGFAAVLHGCNQTTRDIDICFAVSPEGIQQLRSILAPLHPRHRMTADKLDFLEHPRAELERINNLYLETDLGILDIISSVTGVGTYEHINNRAQNVTIFGHSCKVINIEDLISSKQALGRHKDLVVVRELETIHKLQNT